MVTAPDLGLDQERFQVFEGVYRNILPQLRAAGGEPESPSAILDRRNDAVGKPHQRAVWDNYFDTDCGIAGDKERIYVAPHSPRLRGLTSRTRLVSGGIPLPTNDFPAGVRVYAQKDHILGRDLTEQEARESQLWLDWADGDQARLDRYVENTFRLGRDTYKYDTMMGIFVPKDAIERALFVHRLYVRSGALGGSGLYDLTRLVGVRRGVAPVASQQGSHERSDLRDAQEKKEVPGAPAAAAEMKAAAIDDVLQFSRNYVPPEVWAEYEVGLRQRLTFK